MDEPKRPTCATCPFFDPTGEVVVRRLKKGETASSMEFEQVSLGMGACKRYPTYDTPKRQGEWCGEHPEMAPYIEARKRYEDERRTVRYVAPNGRPLAASFKTPEEADRRRQEMIAAGENVCSPPT